MPTPQWITADFYNGTYGGTPIQDDKFNAIACAAERTVDQITQFKLSQKDFSTWPTFIQNKILMAISAQMEYFYEIGAHSEAGMQTVQSASIGGFHYQMPTSDQSTRTQLQSDVARQYLEPTGLMYAGLEIRDRTWTGRYGYGWNYD
ncbi:hypothetical protein [Sporolactobacillus laevolacticus]|uniref:Uncharacterized protein n=1 Tax=Sporolactobacillus laevolacticus DSM 442 TaxID=1395513 RepID=V6IXA9_9BACL|nr:hypothetical protein [Sporolactobacillus laevolacticus]EST11261.1 hypothetical protein P343_12650 [Sporolactobacillus laevolacticus DSM 442]